MRRGYYRDMASRSCCCKWRGPTFSHFLTAFPAILSDVCRHLCQDALSGDLAAHDMVSLAGLGLTSVHHPQLLVPVHHLDVTRNNLLQLPRCVSLSALCPLLVCSSSASSSQHLKATPLGQINVKKQSSSRTLLLRTVPDWEFTAMFIFESSCTCASQSQIYGQIAVYESLRRQHTGNVTVTLTLTRTSGAALIVYWEARSLVN